MKKTVICYKTTEPTYYNKGTENEKACDTFLAYYTYKTIEEAQAECDKLNAEHPEKLWNGERINWAKVAYFFINEQEEMH